MVENTRSINIAATIILIFGMLYILLPLYLAIMTATYSYAEMARDGVSFIPSTHLIDNLRRVFTATHVPAQILNSVSVALMVAVGKCVVSFAMAFSLVYYNIRWRSLWFALVLATIMLPVDVRVITTYAVASNILSPLNALLDVSGLSSLLTNALGHPVHFELNLLDTRVGLAAPLIAQGTGTFMFRQFFRTLPGDLVKAAKMDGAGPLRFMWDILVPLSKTPFAALFVLMFLGGWTEYLWPLVATSTPDMQTAVVGLAHLVTNDLGVMPDYPLIMAGAILVSLIPLLVIVLLQRYLVRGLVLSEK